MRLLLCILTTVGMAGVAGAVLRWWQTAPPIVAVSRREPAPAAAAPPVALNPTDHCNRLVTQFTRLLPTPEPTAAALASVGWPGFRGPERNAIASDPTPLAEAWPAGGPPVLWTAAVGDGHAGPAIFQDGLYLLDYDEDAKTDVLRCLALADGRELWRRSYPVLTKRNHGMSRTVPAVTDDCIVTIGPQCQVMCVERTTGDYRWGLDLALDYGTTVPLWYTAQCPLLDQGLAIIAPCGRDLLLALDCRSGEVVWRTPNPDGWLMSHSSIVTMRFGAQRAFVYAALGGMVAVQADGPERGRVLWSSTAWDKKIVAPCPVQLDDARILMTSGHGVGSAILTLTQSGGTWTVSGNEAIAKTLCASEQQTPIWLQGLLYTVLPKDAGEHREELACFDPAGAGHLLWTSGKELRFGLGPYLAADGKVYLLDDRGTLTMGRASREGFRVLGQTQALPDARDAWGPPALVRGRLLLRDATRLVCLDVARQKEN
jgi:outer membrane protein assembly factor BamB